MKINLPMSKINYCVDLLTIVFSIAGAVYYQINQNQTMLYWMLFSMSCGILAIIFKPMDRLQQKLLLLSAALLKKNKIKPIKNHDAVNPIHALDSISIENQYSLKLVGYKSVNITKYSISILS